MGNFTFLCTMLLFSVNSLAEDEGCNRVIQAGTGVIDGKLVRYLTFFDDPCIVIQTLKPGGRGGVNSENKVCSSDGKSFRSGYADVELKSGKFDGGKLYLEISLTPLEPAGEVIEQCEVIFLNEEFDGLRCAEIE